MNVTWTEEAIRALGVKTDVATAASILGISTTRAYDRIKDGMFPVPVITIAGRIAVPTAPILRLLGIDPDAPGETSPAAIDPDKLADMVADRVVSRLATAMAAAARVPAEAPRPLRSVADSGPEAA